MGQPASRLLVSAAPLILAGGRNSRFRSAEAPHGLLAHADVLLGRKSLELLYELVASTSGAHPALVVEQLAVELVSSPPLLDPRQRRKHDTQANKIAPLQQGLRRFLRDTSVIRVRKKPFKDRHDFFLACDRRKLPARGSSAGP